MNDSHTIILFFLKSFQLSLILFCIVFTSLQSYKCIEKYNKNKIATTQGKQLKLKLSIFQIDTSYLLLLKFTKIQRIIYLKSNKCDFIRCTDINTNQIIFKLRANLSKESNFEFYFLKQLYFSPIQINVYCNINCSL